jgi:hypothetical protein
MLFKSKRKLARKTHTVLKWQLTALSGALTTGLIVFLES